MAAWVDKGRAARHDNEQRGHGTNRGPQERPGNSEQGTHNDKIGHGTNRGPQERPGNRERTGRTQMKTHNDKREHGTNRGPQERPAGGECDTRSNGRLQSLAPAENNPWDLQACRRNA